MGNLRHSPNPVTLPCTRRTSPVTPPGLTNVVPMCTLTPVFRSPFVESARLPIVSVKVRMRPAIWPFIAGPSAEMASLDLRGRSVPSVGKREAKTLDALTPRLLTEITEHLSPCKLGGIPNTSAPLCCSSVRLTSTVPGTAFSICIYKRHQPCSEFMTKVRHGRSSAHHALNRSDRSVM
jgi:hypothetical protein